MAWLRHMLRRDRDEGEGEEDMNAARAEHRAALSASDSSRKHVDRVIAERKRIDAMMREADVSMFGERMERR